MTIGAQFNYLRSRERHYVQPVDVDEEFQRLLAEFQLDQPQWTPDVTDPAYRVLRMMAQAKADQANFANGVARASSVAYATGDAVDDLGLGVGLVRKQGETDERFLRRIVLEPIARYNIGSGPFIQSSAYAADDSVADVQVKGRGDGWQVDVWVTSSDPPPSGENRGTATPALVARVSDYVNDDTRIIADHRNIVTAATVTKYAVTAALTFDRDEHDSSGVISRARTRMESFVQAAFEIGQGVSMAQIEAVLFGLDRDVLTVTLTSPSANLAATDGTAYLCEPDDTDITITATAV